MRLEPVVLDTCNSRSDSLCLEPSFLVRCVTAGSSEATACTWSGGGPSQRGWGGVVATTLIPLMGTRLGNKTSWVVSELRVSEKKSG